MSAFLKRTGKNKKRLVPLVLIASLLLGGSIFLLNKVQAFPTNTTVLDNFNRADTGSIASSPASGPYNWASTGINSSNTTELGISSNQLYKANNANNAYINHVFGPDTEVSVDASSPPGSGLYTVLWARIQNPGSSSFDSYALVYINNGSDATWSLRRYNSSSMTQLASLNTPLIAPGDSLGFAVTGTGSTVTLTAYQKSAGTWSTIGSVNDTSASRITSAGYIGIEIGDNTFSAKFDNFSGGDIINNVAPGDPTLSLPADNATGVSTTPQFELRATDADNDDLRYKIEICADTACTNIVRTIDQTASQIGWSGQDKAGGTAYTGAPTLASSTLAAYSYQTPALANNTHYWWRAYAIDPAGTNTFSPASSIFSFITAAATSGANGNSGAGNNNNSSSQQLDTNLTPSDYSTWGK